MLVIHSAERRHKELKKLSKGTSKMMIMQSKVYEKLFSKKNKRQRWDVIHCRDMMMPRKEVTRCFSHPLSSNVSFPVSNFVRVISLCSLWFLKASSLVL